MRTTTVAKTQIDRVSTYRSVTSLKAVDSGLRGCELVSRDNLLQFGLDDLPKLIVLVLEQENDARALAVET